MTEKPETFDFIVWDAFQGKDPVTVNAMGPESAARIYVVDQVLELDALPLVKPLTAPPLTYVVCVADLKGDDVRTFNLKIDLSCRLKPKDEDA